MNSFGQVVGTIALLVAAVAGLSMSLCGGAFTLMGMGTIGLGVLVISVPSMLIGLWVLWATSRKLRGRFATRPPK